MVINLYIYIIFAVIIFFLSLKMLISIVQVHALILYMIEKKYEIPTKKEFESYCTRLILYLLKFKKK